MIRPVVNWAVSALKELKETKIPLEKLQSDMDSFTNISSDLKFGRDSGKELEAQPINYVDALTSNIKDRLGSYPKVIEAFAIFDPHLLPSSNEESFKEYGEAEILRLQYWPITFSLAVKTRRPSYSVSGSMLSFFCLLSS